MTLVVADDGVGLPQSVNIKQVESLGLHLVTSFIEQLQGSYTLERIGGTTFIISFPKQYE